MKRWCTVLAAAAVWGISQGAWADNYVLDPVHCSAVFRIKHNNASYVYGRINAPEGAIVYDPAKPEASSFNITMKVSNVDTGNSMRDNHLKSPTFFNAKEFPTLTFKSSAVKKGEGDALEVSGNLTIHGITRPVTVTIDHTGDGKGGVIGFESTFTVNRSDYGMTEMSDVVGNDVRIIVAFEAKKK